MSQVYLKMTKAMSDPTLGIPRASAELISVDSADAEPLLAAGAATLVSDSDAQAAQGKRSARRPADDSDGGMSRGSDS